MAAAKNMAWKGSNVKPEKKSQTATAAANNHHRCRRYRRHYDLDERRNTWCCLLWFNSTAMAKFQVFIFRVLVVLFVVALIAFNGHRLQMARMRCKHHHTHSLHPIALLEWTGVLICMQQCSCFEHTSDCLPLWARLSMCDDWKLLVCHRTFTRSKRINWNSSIRLLLLLFQFRMRH